MNIQIGECYVNKTWRFLLPCLRGHGDVFVRKFNPVFKLAVGIHDMLVDGSPIMNGRSIFILCDKLVHQREFENFLEWIKYQSYYIADYCPDSEILKSRKHVIVVAVPERFNDAYDHFLQGSYSTMYLEDEIKLLFSGEVRKQEYDILMRGAKTVDDFVKKVNIEFGTTAMPEDFKMAELDFPLVKTEEIFNYKQGDTIYFNEQIDKVWKT